MLATGTKLRPYEILSPIGAGGMREVYLARDTRLDRIAAIKILPDHLASRAELRERFEREARTIKPGFRLETRRCVYQICVACVDVGTVYREGGRSLGTVTLGKEAEKKRAEAKALSIRVDFLYAGDSRTRLRGDKIAGGKRNKDAMVAGTIFLGPSGPPLRRKRNVGMPRVGPRKCIQHGSLLARMECAMLSSPLLSQSRMTFSE
jgi:hypothetical protein